MPRPDVQIRHSGRMQISLDWTKHDRCGGGAWKSPNQIKRGGHGGRGWRSFDWIGHNGSYG